MAKKRRGKTARRGRRGRVGGIIPKKYQSDTYLALGMVGGLLLARVVPGVIAKIAPGASPKVTNLIQAGIGVFGAVTTAKMPLIRGVSLGVAAMGAMDLATNIGLLPGADGAVGAREVLIDLNGGMGYGYPRNLVAGNVGANFADKAYVDSVIAGNVMHGMGLYV